MPPRTETWSDLPPELLVTIADHHCTPLDVLRLRSICRSWRDATTHNRPIDSSHESIPLPFPMSTTDGKFTLNKFTVCYLESVDHRKRWLVKIEEIGPGRYRALDPVSTVKLVGFPKMLNLVDMRVIEIARSFSFSCLDAKLAVSDINMTIKKVVVSSVDGTVKSGDLVMVKFAAGFVLHIRFGDDKCRPLEDFLHNFYCDVIFRKERFYAVDGQGGLVIVDTSMNVEICPWTGIPQNSFENKYLVEDRVEGRLYLVVHKNFLPRDVDNEDSAVGQVSDEDEVSPVCFEVFCFKEEEKTWVRVYSLGELAFFVAEDCSYSVVARDCPPYMRNCIYYADYDAGDSTVQSCCVFDFEKGYIQKQGDMILFEA